MIRFEKLTIHSFFVNRLMLADHSFHFGITLATKLKKILPVLSSFILKAFRIQKFKSVQLAKGKMS